jgi:hypothetical protein
MAKFIVDLQYFKPMGKFYTEGKIEVPETWQMYQISDHVENLRNSGEVPGLIKRTNHNFYSVYINAENHPNGYPVLINSTQDKNYGE